MKVNIKPIYCDFILPKKATDGSACFDLSYPYDQELIFEAGDIIKVPLGFKVEIPIGYVMLLFPRSGLAYRDGINLVNCVGIIDSDYRGEVCALLYKECGFDDSLIRKGERVCQALIIPYPEIEFNISETLNDTARGEKGFGSTGK